MPRRKNAGLRRIAGIRIGEILELDMDLKANKEKVKGLLKTWIKTGVFKIVKEKDPDRREMKDFVIVGESITAQP